jgi:hypothetical protein
MGSLPGPWKPMKIFMKILEMGREGYKVSIDPMLPPKSGLPMLSTITISTQNLWDPLLNGFVANNMFNTDLFMDVEEAIVEKLILHTLQKHLDLGRTYRAYKEELKLREQKEAKIIEESTMLEIEEEPEVEEKPDFQETPNRKKKFY